MIGHAWTEADFDAMSWHDNHVHALRVEEGEWGAGRLILDIDYILEWLKSDDGRVRFRILPATLTFNEVTNLRIALDYATPTAGLCPFSLDRIERRAEQRERHVATVWTLCINWPQGEISFDAAGFEQRGSAAPVLSDGQCLVPADRGG